MKLVVVDEDGVREMDVSGEDETIGLMWFVHFGDLDPALATCDKCADLAVGVCPGRGLQGVECYECVAEEIAIAGGSWIDPALLN